MHVKRHPPFVKLHSFVRERTEEIEWCVYIKMHVSCCVVVHLTNACGLPCVLHKLQMERGIPHTQELGAVKGLMTEIVGSPLV